MNDLRINTAVQDLLATPNFKGFDGGTLKLLLTLQSHMIEVLEHYAHGKDVESGRRAYTKYMVDTAEVFNSLILATAAEGMAGRKEKNHVVEMFISMLYAGWATSSCAALKGEGMAKTPEEALKLIELCRVRGMILAMQQKGAN